MTRRLVTQKRLSYVAGVMAVVAFVLLAGGAIVWANGWQFDIDSGQFQPTAVIGIEVTQPTSAKVYLNDELVSQALPITLRGLKPGFYQLRLTSPGYYDWLQSWQLTAGQAVKVSRGSSLILKNPTPKVTALEGQFISEPAFDDNIAISNSGEITDSGHLVTTLTAAPTRFNRFNDGYIYQAGNQLRLFFPQGFQDYLIYQLPSDQLAQLKFDPGSWRVLLASGDQQLTLDLNTN